MRPTNCIPHNDLSLAGLRREEESLRVGLICPTAFCEGKSKGPRLLQSRGPDLFLELSEAGVISLMSFYRDRHIRCNGVRRRLSLLPPGDSGAPAVTVPGQK
jgi:hypothetical protein